MPFRARALIIDDDLGKLETSLGRATENLSRVLEERGVDVTRVADVLPELAAQHPERYRRIGLRDLGDEMLEYIRLNRPGELLNRAFATLPVPDMTPREAYARIVANDIEHVPVEALAHRTAANGVMPYPPGIPMLMSGENFGDDDGPQIGYMRGLAAWDKQFPGFEHVTEGAEAIDGTYHVLCVR